MIEFKKQPIIEFDGQPTGQCKKFMQKKEAKIGVFLAFLYVGLIGILMIIALIEFTSLDLFLILGSCVPVMIGIIVLAGVYPCMKGAESSFLPLKIIFHKNGHMESISKSFHWVKTTDNVEQVIDYGAWYEIKFVPSEKNFRFVCQKDLLVKGTIEDFEKMFEGKLIRK